jgi:glycosyltransferase involved in cell wall biosynthesis
MSEVVSVIVPIWNQADQIQEIVDEYRGSLTSLGCCYEILLVVNGSFDASLEMSTRAAEPHGDVQVLSLATAGWGAAVKAGVRAAAGSLLCYTNSARTRGTDLARVIEYAAANPGNVVKATRRLRDGAMRRAGSLLFNAECRLLFDLSVWDINGTPKAFPRALSRLLDLRSDDDLFDAEFMLTCREAGYPVLEVPIEFTGRRGGRSSTNMRSAVRLYWGALRLRDRRRRTPQ